MGFGDLAIIGIHQQISAVAVQHAGPAAGDRRRVLVGIDAVTGRFDAIDFNGAVIEKRMKQTHRVRSAANAGNQ